MNVYESPIVSEVDFDKPGKHQGFLRLPHSVHRSAYGWIPIPVVSVRNGEGPTCLLMSGNHGDEYEGQVALCKLTGAIDPAQVNGQVIILPMANFPAAKAGLRTSPIDDGNLNRCFPGDPRGSVTEIIAHYIEEVLLARCDYLLDIHSGGSSLLYLPTAMMVRDEDDDMFQANLEILDALQFPHHLVYPESLDGTFSSSGASRKGVLAITLEVAGGGAIDTRALMLLERGLQRYLVKCGILDADTGTGENEIDPAGSLMEARDMDYYCYAPCSGLFEPAVDLGQEVEGGDLAGLVHDPETPWQPPVQVHFVRGGKVICKRVPARLERGDCLFQLATRLDFQGA